MRYALLERARGIGALDTHPDPPASLDVCNPCARLSWLLYQSEGLLNQPDAGEGLKPAGWGNRLSPPPD